MNALLEKVIESRNGHYCHVVEVSEAYELESIAEAVISENEYLFDAETIIDFLETLTVYFLENEEDLKAYVDYGEKIPAVVGENGLWGMQFHPEKSARMGMKMIKNFGELVNQWS